MRWLWHQRVAVFTPALDLADAVQDPLFDSMKPAFSYYGGKQRMASNIVPLITKHTVYVEPFAGGAAVFFAKSWTDVSNQDHYREVLNDSDGCIVNFYRVLRDQPDALIRSCCLTPYAREEHRNAIDDDCLDPIERARRWFVDIQQSFSNKSRGGWRTGVFGRNLAATWQNQTARLYACADRLMSVHIEHDDALAVIERWDSPQTFFYCDPPYPDTDQGHYNGYDRDDFSALIDVLDSCQGSFILSNYDQLIIPDHWERFEFDAYCSASSQGQVGNGRDKSAAVDQLDLGLRDRTEILWRVIRGDNVRPEIAELYQQGLFDCFEAREYA